MPVRVRVRHCADVGGYGDRRCDDRVERITESIEPAIAGRSRLATVAVIGAGKIGEVLLSGLLRSGWPADRLLATARRTERAAELAQRYGIRVVDTADAVAAADVLAIAVKPQDAAALMAELGPLIVPGSES